MADVSKAQKLASARKKFKELKKEKKKSTNPKNDENAESAPTSREQTPVENVIEAGRTEDTSNGQTHLLNYFNNVNYNNEYHQPAAFFDTFDTIQNKNASLHQPNVINQNYSELTHNYSNHEAENVSTSLNIVENIADEAAPSSVENLDAIPPEVASVSPPEHTFEGNKSEEIADFHAFDTIKLNQNAVQLSATESLRQLSNEMAELIDPNLQFTPSAFESRLEARNQELTELLTQEKIKVEELTVTLRQYESRISQLEAAIRDKELNSDIKTEQHLSGLREELQCHVQTVGILVAEKTELTASLNQYQLAAKQKTSECEELQGRLKTSRSRVADLEREVALLKSEKSQFDSFGKERTSEVESLKRDQQALKEMKEELTQDLLEAREKLKTSSENNLLFQQQIAELSNQLSMANIKIQQLTAGELDHASAQVEQLTQEKFTLEKQVSNLNHTVKTLSKEREESSLQYQQYAQQLNAQLSNLAAKLEQLQKENESLVGQEQNRIKHIGELEKQLQNLQNDQVSFSAQRSNGEMKAELDAALKAAEALQIANSQLEEEHVRVINERDLLLNSLEERADNIKELETLVQELKGNQPDNAKLLATMESDKVAAARAVAQNTELKAQMDSMQEVFMKLNNDKIELTEKLTSEQRHNRDLFEKLQKTEIHLQTLADAIEIKDKELSHLREDSFELNKQVLQSEQLTDRLRHYEAQDNSSPSLQTELQEAQMMVSKLTEELNRWKKVGVEKDTSQDDTIRQEAELRRQLENLQLKNKELESQLLNDHLDTDTNHNDHWNSLDKESAMKHLEQKFLKTMEEIANLTDEKQRLEHLVLQLQGETETIGEYVALYQHQRSLLKQKTIEKDQQLTQLANDREHMKNKLEKLNELVRKLVLEKGAVPSELLERHDNQLCEEHAKIHSEINKIAQNSFTVEPDSCDSPQGAETAEQIIALLSEIKSSNLVQPTENFHHCPWCSGQLITV